MFGGLNMNILVSAEEVVRYYGRVKALDKFSFIIPKGTSVLVGPNGAGKTTTIKIMAGILKAHCGNISILGYDPWKEKEKLIGKIAFLLEETPLKLSIRVKDYMKLFSKKFGTPYNELTKIIENMGLKQHLFKPVSALSAGLKKRLLISQCLLLNPEIIIMDEPFSNLDPISIFNILNIIKELKRDEGLSFLISSHFLPFLEDIIDYIIIIDNGRKLVEGEYRSIVRKFISSYEYRRLKIVSTHIDKVIELIKKYKEVDILEIKRDKVILKIPRDHHPLIKMILRDILESEIEIEAIEVLKPTLNEIYIKMIESANTGKVN